MFLLYEQFSVLNKSVLYFPVFHVWQYWFYYIRGIQFRIWFFLCSLIVFLMTDFKSITLKNLIIFFVNQISCEFYGDLFFKSNLCFYFWHMFFQVFLQYFLQYINVCVACVLVISYWLLILCNIFIVFLTKKFLYFCYVYKKIQ